MGSRWMLAGRPVLFPDRCAVRWFFVTVAVPFLLVMFRLSGATCIMRSIGLMVVPRVCPICCWFALRITIPLITPTGRSVSPPTDCPNGSRRSASTPAGAPAATTGTSVPPHHHRHLNNRTTPPGAGASHPTREAAPAHPHAPQPAPQAGIPGTTQTTPPAPENHPTAENHP